MKQKSTQHSRATRQQVDNGETMLICAKRKTQQKRGKGAEMDKILKLKRQFDLILKGYAAFVEEGATPNSDSTDALLSAWMELDNEIEKNGKAKD